MWKPDSASPRALRVGRYALALSAAWTVVVVGMIAWTSLEGRSEALGSAGIQARRTFEEGLIYRH